jgi:hypothetical protein
MTIFSGEFSLTSASWHAAICVVASYEWQLTLTHCSYIYSGQL